MAFLYITDDPIIGMANEAALKAHPLYANIPLTLALDKGQTFSALDRTAFDAIFFDLHTFAAPFDFLRAISDRASFTPLFVLSNFTTRFIQDHAAAKGVFLMQDHISDDRADMTGLLQCWEKLYRPLARLVMPGEKKKAAAAPGQLAFV